MVYYDGVKLPGADIMSKEGLVSVKLVSYDEFTRWDNGEIRDPKGIWVELPTTKHELDRTARRLGENSAGDCVIYQSNSEMKIFMTDIAVSPATSPYDVNTLAEILSGYKMPRETEKLEAALEYERYKMPYSKLIEIAANLDCYDYDPQIKFAEDFIVKYGGDPVKLARYDDADVDELMKEYGGKITEYGYVARNDKPFELAYEHTKPEQEQGMALQ